MEKSSKVRVESKQPVNLNIDEEKNFFYNEPDTVTIRSLVDAQVKLTGAVSGNVYIWPHAGVEIVVDARDKDEILNKKRGRACCGGQSGKALFELV